MQLVNVSGSSSYPVYIGAGLLPQLGSLYRRHGLGGRALVVSDETVIELYADTVLDSLKANDVEPVPVGIPAGEASKSLHMADQLYERLIQHRFERNAVIVALGGGVVGDLAGFVAATYLRGVSLIQVPTTLLAQVDSAIGGKTGVNHSLGKNLIGSFYAPSLVVADLGTLASLPQREWRSGLAEVVKYGLIADRALFEQTEALAEKLGAGSPELEALVSRCVAIKAKVVSEDERESGRRKVLNFGHTLGHALESITEYKHFRHGEAVLWGMLGEAFLSQRFGALSEMEFVRIRRLLSRLEKPALPEMDQQTLLAHVQRDKKNRDGRVHMVWLRHIGKCQVQPIDARQLREVIGFWATETQGMLL